MARVTIYRDIKEAIIYKETQLEQLNPTLHRHISKSMNDGYREGMVELDGAEYYWKTKNEVTSLVAVLDNSFIKDDDIVTGDFIKKHDHTEWYSPKEFAKLHNEDTVHGYVIAFCYDEEFKNQIILD